MKTAVFTGIREVGLQECKTPVAKGNKVLVKIDACAICTWEQRVYTGVNKVEFPFIGGHEIAGEIVSMGDDVNKTEWTIGDKVVVGATLQCRNCYYCKTGNSQSCEHFNHSAHLEGLPYRGMGGLSEYLLVSPDCIFKYRNASPNEACMIEPLSCVIHSVETADVQMGDFVLIIGAGIMGLLHTILCQRRGAAVIVSDVNEERLDLARRLGASHVINPSKLDLGKTVEVITKGIKAQVVFDTTPIPAVVQDTFKCVSNAGRIVLYSSIHPAEPVLFDPNWVHGKSIGILGTANSNDRDFMRAAQMISEGVIDLKPFISEVYPSEKIQAAFESVAKADKFRVVVTF
ncbi:zinc-dependent alcohol dehydrogenase [Pectinatus haikarae]|uniref:2-desacetyl-2-hydroxyethyl bacteriochlorophyllide A dehydrogenase n=1 Tax=Pectinatus haikarae TaxID=349096 RepID=A0ABT9Y5X9_9FIRM|nr:alcohol dehydrogenase catalytic domain-containing protein [Pectinatus haikarae]MDQ0203240.1 2-desacetyl-2-hydroxyethyl bacteriochlorophyllide A dehydrogenase [Pectinatus haikarae]